MLFASCEAMNFFVKLRAVPLKYTYFMIATLRDVKLDADPSRGPSHQAVSRVHAVVVNLGSGPYIVDAGSTNGVRLNGVKIPPASRLPWLDKKDEPSGKQLSFLKAGDVLTFGEITDTPNPDGTYPPNKFNTYTVVTGAGICGTGPRTNKAVKRKRCGEEAGSAVTEGDHRLHVSKAHERRACARVDGTAKRFKKAQIKSNRPPNTMVQMRNKRKIKSFVRGGKGRAGFTITLDGTGKGKGKDGKGKGKGGKGKGRGGKGKGGKGNNNGGKGKGKGVNKDGGGGKRI